MHERRIDDHEARLAGLEGSVSKLADLSGGKETLKQLQAAVEGVTSSTAGLAASVEVLKEEAGEMKDRVESLSKRMADSKGGAGDGEGAAAAAAAVAAAEAAEMFAKLDSGMAQLEAEGSERDSALGDIREELESLRAWVDALHEQVVAGRREAQAAPLNDVSLVRPRPPGWIAAGAKIPAHPCRRIPERIGRVGHTV